MFLNKKTKIEFDIESFVKNESELVPYTTSLLPKGPYLIFAPHPDDETFGMGGTIAQAAQLGTEVSVIIVSDGTKAGNMETRQVEAKNAASILGAKNIIFWNLADREIQNQSNVFAEKFKYEINKVNPKTIFAPSLLEYHPDHRATTILVWMSLQKYDLDSQIWLYEITRQGEANHLIDITPTIDLKKKAINCYKSQINQLPYEDIVLSINRARTYTLPQKIKYAEAFWEVEIGKDILSVSSKIKNYVKGFPKGF